ncbi:MAG: ATP-binding protein [Planctomycetes bacterium]|nr:ATP-binding protein [Planctomycetota bacterium]
MEEQVKTGNRASLLAAGSALLVLAVGWVDYATGEELSVAILYLVPICLSTWRVGRPWGLWVALASAVAWLAADSAASRRQGYLLVPYWNAVVLLGFFWVVVYLLSELKTSHEGLEGQVEHRTLALRREISERVQAQERLTQVNDELSQSRERLVEALADLQKSHAELKATQWQLIEATKLESIGRLAAGVAHEVKNPLMTLTMVADYLAQVIPADEPDAPSMLRDMREAIQRANRVISELLEFSRPGELTLKPEDLHAVMDRALSLVKLELAHHHIDVIRQLATALPTLPMDKNKIEQVLVNIFMNAIQAMPQGGTLTIRTSAAPMGQTGSPAIVVEIDDTGPGIPAAHLARVFDPFFTTKAAGQGTGLGLCVAQQIVQLHGGTIALANRPEGGARVTIMLNSQPRN